MSTESNFRKGTALVTGSGVRLGKAIALGLAQSGYNVAVHYHSSAGPAAETVAEIQALGVESAAFQHDLNQIEALPSLIATVQERFPDLNVLVNSASGYTQASIMETTPEIFEDQLRVNLQAPFFLLQAFARQVKEGSIVNILDNKIGFNQPQYAAYLLAKKSLADLTRMAAIELAPDFRVNGVAPGVVMPADSRSEDYVNWRVQGIPVLRQGQTDNIVQAVNYVINNDFVTGQVLVVDGGESQTNTGFNAATYAGGADKK